ncbi:hypothetical protein FVE85_5035 [Porphyridium purpureum]|uniref:Uncharacterized protein n=1 Tax=Porphyridium purpureum TaxID=35688 RepID=A0A5J4YI29_PORPP|nr:hypothetical protein FVE85_5035 [Porphyridium purpureum]|eukprot:POR9184..scf237_24
MEQVKKTDRAVVPGLQRRAAFDFELEVPPNLSDSVHRSRGRRVAALSALVLALLNIKIILDDAGDLEDGAAVAIYSISILLIAAMLAWEVKAFLQEKPSVDRLERECAVREDQYVQLLDLASRNIILNERC